MSTIIVVTTCEAGKVNHIEGKVQRLRLRTLQPRGWGGLSALGTYISPADFLQWCGQTRRQLFKCHRTLHRGTMQTMQMTKPSSPSRFALDTYQEAWPINYHSSCTEFKCLNVIAHCTEEELCKWQKLRHQVASLWIRTKRLDRSTITLTAQSLNV